jgi:hypothetical protein
MTKEEICVGDKNHYFDKKLYGVYLETTYFVYELSLSYNDSSLSYMRVVSYSY